MTSDWQGDSVPTALASDLRRDPWAQALGLEFLELRRGQCRFALTLKPHMLNSPRNPHGGVIFSLADVAVYGVTVSTEEGVAVTSVHCVAHRVDRRSP